MNRPHTYFDTVSTGRRTVDLLVLSSLFVLGLVGFRTVYGGVQYLITGLTALAFALLIALVAARFRWGPLRVTPTLLAVYFLFGSMFAAPTHALFGAIPTLRSLWELLKAPVTTWKSVLTVAPPVGTAQAVLAVVWISMLLLGFFAFTIVMRTRFYMLALLFPMVLWGLTILFGTTAAYYPMLRGIIAALITVAWLTWRFESARLSSSASTIISDTVRPGSWKNPVLRRRVIGGALIMLLAVGGSLAARPLLDPPEGTQRYALRDRISPPFDPREYVSPLADFRGYVKHKREQTLFTISGVKEGEKVRLATLDQYDLQVYNVAGSQKVDSVSGMFVRTAGGVDLHEPTSNARTSTVTIGEYSDVWMPTLGTRTDRINTDGLTGDRAASMAENLYLNDMSQTAVQAGRLAEGDTYELEYEPYSDPTAEQQRSATFDANIAARMPDNAAVPSEFGQLADEWMGTSDSDMEKFQNLLRSLKQDAYYSHGIENEPASLSGHSLSRLSAMFEEGVFDKNKADDYPKGKIGDEEQYAVLAAVLAREIDIPARVVMGFEVPAGTDGNATITGDDVTAWVEVAFTDIGWVRFDAAPDNDDDPVQPEPKKIEKPRPQVAQPPPPPAEPPSPPPGAMSDDAPEPPEEPQETAAWVVYTAIALTPLLLFTLFVIAVATAKWWRRRQRRGRDSVADRVDGGWDEILDLLTDMGRRPDPVATRAEIAATVDADIPGARAFLLAGRADRATFGPHDLAPAAADEYWNDVMAARRSMASSVPWHRRLRALLSLKSFRRRRSAQRAERKRSKSIMKERASVERRAQAVRRRRAGASMQKRSRRRWRKGGAR